MKHTYLAYASAVAGLAFAAIGQQAQASSFDGLDVNLVGSATEQGSGSGASLVLTPAAYDQAGAAWLTSAVSTSNAFSSTFSFVLDNPGGLGNADGLALVFQNQGTGVVGQDGGNLGANIPDSVTPGGAVVAFLQTYQNSYGVGQNTDSSYSVYGNSNPTGVALWTASVISGTETVTYDPTTYLLTQQIQLSYAINGVTSSISLNASATENLGALFGPSVTVGITGATGSGFANQAVTSWSVSSIPEPMSALLASAGLGVAGLLASRRSKAARAAV